MRFSSYEVVQPGDLSFICDARLCDALCCRSLSVPLGDRDVERLETGSALGRVQLVECEGGIPIALPLSQPYLLLRREGQCALLSPDLACGQYEFRPDACRSYPFQAILVDEQTGRPRGAAGRSLVDVLAGTSGVHPVLLRHRACPGFTGPPLTAADWRRLVNETWDLGPGRVDS